MPVAVHPVPGAPTGVTGVPGDGQVSLAWVAPKSNGGLAISDYVVQVSSNAGAAWTNFADGVSTATSARVTGLKNGTSYVFRVAAVNAAGAGAVSVASTAITPLPPAPPNMPTGVTVASSTDTAVTISWNDVSGESDYRIERSNDSATWTEVGRRAADITTFTDARVEESSRYSYRVIAVNAAGASIPSAVLTVETRLRAPAGVVATVVNGGRIDLSWVDRSSRETEYTVEQFDRSTNAWSRVGEAPADSNGMIVTGSFTPNTTYQFRVRAVTWYWWWGSTTVSSEDVPTSVATPAYPNMPGGLTVASATESSVTLSWNDVSGERDYRIERSNDHFVWLGRGQATWLEVGRKPADTTTFTDTGLEEGARYNYRVIAVNAAGASAPSTLVTAETRLRAPASLVATVVDGGRIDLTWVDRSSCEAQYVVEQFDRATNGWTPVGVAPVDGTGMIVTGAFVPSTTYQFRVRAETWYSMWGYTYASSEDVTASVVTPAYPAAPGGLAATAFIDSVRLSWEVRADVSVVVERTTGGSGLKTVTELTSVATPYEDENLEPSTAYTYRIAFRNAHGTSSFSESASVVTAAGPTVVAAHRSTSAVFVAWTCPLQGVTGIAIERVTSGSDAWTAIAAVAGTATGYTDTAVVLGESYRYRIVFERRARSPFIARSGETGPEPNDADGDQIADGEELAIGTNPRAFSTDSDLLGDGFERSNGLDPLAGDEDGNGVSDQYDDFDGDGLATWQEGVFGTSTSRADTDGDGRPDGVDSDGDGVSDGAEVSQGSDPANARDLGEAPAADARIKLRLTVGDPSGSHSEQWALRVGGIRQVSPAYGEVGSGEYFFDVGKSYPITLEHQGTRYGDPDYDWYANIEPTNRPEFFVVDGNTPLYIIGPYQGDGMSSRVSSVRGLEAQLHVPRLDVDVDSSNDSGFAIPEDTVTGDRLENDGSTGKRVFAMTGDVDEDGIADSSDFGGITGASFVPMVVRLSSNIAAAQPSAISVSFDYDPTVFRLWKPGCDAGTARTANDIIPARTWVTAEEIGLEPGESAVVYVEALKGGPSGGVPVTTSVRVEAARWSGTLTDLVHLLPVELDLDVDSNNDGRIAEDDDPIEEQSPGRILFVNSDDDDGDGVADVLDVGRIAGENDLAEIVLAASLSIGSGACSLIVTYDEAIIRLYTRPDRSGGIVSGSTLARGCTLYAEGRTAGTSLVTVTWETDAGRVTDQVRLTVQPYPATIDVDIDSDNNNAFGRPGCSEWEETLEDHPYGIGKLIMLDNPQRPLTPIVLQMPAGLPANAVSVGVQIDWDVVGLAGWVRLWNRSVIDEARNPVPVDKGGNRIFPEFVYRLSDLGYDAADGQIVIYAEGIKENEALKTLAGVEASPKLDERIRGTLVVNGDAAASDEVKYVVANEDSFYYQLQTRQEVRNALASRGVYTFADMPKFGLEPKNAHADLGVKELSRDLLGPGSSVAGFKAMVYQDYITGKDQYVLAFAGTDDWSVDWYNNFVQGFGYGAPEQYAAAMQISDALATRSDIPAGHLIATGHSLGGGLASAAAVAGGIRADTYNAAWLRRETLMEEDGLGNKKERYPGSLARFAAADEWIDAHYVDHDLITAAQGWYRRADDGLAPVGALREHDGPRDVDMALGIAAIGQAVTSGSPAGLGASAAYVISVMLRLHDTESVLYGLLVTEATFSTRKVDTLGYSFTFL